jgi:hypothetical protein
VSHEQPSARIDIGHAVPPPGGHGQAKAGHKRVSFTDPLEIGPTAAGKQPGSGPSSAQGEQQPSAGAQRRRRHVAKHTVSSSEQQTPSAGCRGRAAGTHKQASESPVPSAGSSTAAPPPSTTAGCIPLAFSKPLERAKQVGAVLAKFCLLLLVLLSYMAVTPVTLGRAAICTLWGLLSSSWGREHRLFRVVVTIDGVPMRALIDSGATHSFVSARVVRRHKLRTAQLTGSVLHVSLADGRTQAVTHVLPSAKLKLGDGQYRHNFKFVVADIAEELILGKDWLQTVNPRIDWQNDCLYVTRSKDAGREICIPSLDTTPASAGAAQPECVISRMQIKRLLRKRSTLAYMVYIKQQSTSTAADTDASVNNASLGEGESTSGTKPGMPPPAADPRIQAVLDKYADVFQTPSGMPPDRDGTGGHRINLEPGKAPPFRPAFRMNSKELEELRTQIQDLLEKGWIRSSHSMYGAPVIFVRKPNGDLRMLSRTRRLIL